MDIASLKDKCSSLPLTPGVYLFKAEDGSYLYIGKAAKLRQRVRSYFSERAGHSAKIDVMKKKMDDLEYIATGTEMEALLLESQLVNKHQPHYNTLLRDDKTYPLVKVTKEEFPRLVITRNRKDKKAIYYGPYTDVNLLREAVQFMHQLFPIRKCISMPKRACLYYHIKQCLGPCVNAACKEEYAAAVDEVRSFFSGKRRGISSFLSEKMEHAKRIYQYEEAAHYKEHIDGLKKIGRKRFYVTNPDGGITLAGTQELKHYLSLQRMPERLVCFDVSNIQGEHAVASAVSFKREMPDKREYRRYQIKTVEGPNDYAMLQEALRRKIKAIVSKTDERPDIIVIDGGKGQLHAAQEVATAEVCTVPIISIAKRFEFIYYGDGSEPLPLEEGSAARNLIMRIRDESHRFAVDYHRALRSRYAIKSVLDTIPGVGPKKRKLLRDTFESVDAIRQASIEIIAALPGFSPALAEGVKKAIGSSKNMKKVSSCLPATAAK